jgi:hypothetical protein
MGTLHNIGSIVVEVQYALYVVGNTTKKLVGIFNTYSTAVQYAEQNAIDIHLGGNGVIDDYTPAVVS